MHRINIYGHSIYHKVEEFWRSIDKDEGSSKLHIININFELQFDNVKEAESALIARRQIAHELDINEDYSLISQSLIEKARI